MSWRNSRLRTVSLAAAAALTLTFVTTATATAGNGMVSGHYAFYVLDLDIPEARMDESGMEYSLVEGCAGWSGDAAMAMRLVMPDGNAMALDTEMTFAEAFDGETAKFDSRANIAMPSMNMQMSVPVTGSLDKRQGVMRLTVQGQTETLAVPDGLMLPIQTTETLVRHFKNGGGPVSLLSAFQFHSVGLQEVTFSPAEAPAGAPPLPADPDGLLSGQSWWLRVDSDSVAAETGQELQDARMRLHESGVVSYMVVAIQGMRMTVSLLEVSSLPERSC